MPQKPNLVYFLCGIINLGYYYESGKVTWAVGVVKNNPNCILDKPLNAFLIFNWLPTFFIEDAPGRDRR